jgi:hypothetical protein
MPARVIGLYIAAFALVSLIERTANEIDVGRR